MFLKRIHFLVFFLLLGWCPYVLAQNSPAFSFEIKKPKNLEDKKLPSEKTGDKKFTVPRRVYQNTVTHYNWYFNGKEKLNEILARAKDAHMDDYTQLLDFYDYTIEQTAKDSIELDSVIIKANSGILLHDLRNDWIDNLYLLMGRAYFYKGFYDTAFLNLQYINYAFAPKEKDGYDKLIGSNSTEGGNAFSISSPETKNVFKKIISHRPSRNESFIWQIRTFLAREEYAEAASMIETLKSDPLFPKRLLLSVSEMQALFFYQQNIYDSAARHLEQALPNAPNREERARWEFLIGQLYELSLRPVEARTFFERASKHTLNPVLEVYARLNMIRQNKGDDKAVTENVASLVRMARKDRYTNYRDIIFYAAAQMELERSNIAGAKALLLKSTQVATEEPADPSQKSKSFLQLGDLTFQEGNYVDAKRFYDSVQVMDIVPDPEKFERRKGVLTTMAMNAAIIERQDSLQKIAGMPDSVRDAFLKKMVKKLRKLEGLKEEEELFIPVNTTAPAAAPAIPADNTDNAKGDWYFYNNSLRSKGYNEFRSFWGNRPNVDNWRRSSAVTKAIQQQFNAPDEVNAKSATEEKEGQGTTYESLMKGLPLTAEKRKISDDSIAMAQLEIGRSLMEGLEDYAAAINILEKYRERFPEHISMPKALLDLVYCYQKIGMLAEADAIKKILQEKYKDSEQNSLLHSVSSTGQQTTATEDMTRRYEKIYTLFIEGQFEAAMKEKKAADELYKNNYWTPQLLYIQSIYLIKERQDESALSVLSDLIKLFPGTVLAEKAERLMEVLGRRQEIENHLRNLKVERPAEEKITIIEDTPPVTAPERPVQVPPVVPTTPITDSVTSQPPLTEKEQQPKVTNPVDSNPPIVPNTIDSVFTDQAKKSDTAEKLKNNDRVLTVPPAENIQPPITQVEKTTEKTISDSTQKSAAVVPKIEDTPRVQNNDLPVSKNAVPLKPTDSVQPAKAIVKDSLKTGISKDSNERKPVADAPVTIAPVKDTIVTVKTNPPAAAVPAPQQAETSQLINGLFLKDAASKHVVLIVMDKVDRIFANEARNAFNRYNAQNPASRSLETNVESLNDLTKLIIIQGFENATLADAYIQRIQPIAHTELIPWLPKEKYYFTLGNIKNLEVIRTLKSVTEYNTSLKALYPDRK